VLVGLRGDPHHQADLLTRVPFDARGNLQHRDAGLANQATILGNAMGNGDAVTEKRVGHAFPSEHALDVSGLDIAGFNQQRADLADSLRLVGRIPPNANRGGIESNHGIVLPTYFGAPPADCLCISAAPLCATERPRSKARSMQAAGYRISSSFLPFVSLIKAMTKTNDRAANAA
jgi:hypothetical protein